MNFRGSSRGRKILFTAVVLGALAVATGLLAEATVRVRGWLKHGSASVLEDRFRIDPASGLRIPSADKGSKSIRIDSRGFRSPELVVPKPAGTVRIAFLGGSTTFCAEGSSNEATWPHLVWQALQTAHPNVRFDYLNASAPGYATPALLRSLQHRVRPLEPDVIVIYEATNDLSLDSAALARERGLLTSRPDEGSWPGRYSMTWFLIEKNLTVRRRQAATANPEGKLIVDPRELSRGFEQRLMDLVTGSQEVAPVVAVGVFAPRLRRGQPLDEQRMAAITAAYYMPYLTIEGLIQGYEEYNRVIRGVARSRGAVLVETESAIPPDVVHYTDSVHFTDAGSLKMAERVSKALLGSVALSALLESRTRARAEDRALPWAASR